MLRDKRCHLVPHVVLLAPLCCVPVTPPLISSATFAMLCAARTAILEFVDLPPSLTPPPPPCALPPQPFIFFFLSPFLSASCQHWQSATWALAARLVTDAAAVRQRGEKGTGVKMERGQNREGEKEQEREWLREGGRASKGKKKGGRRRGTSETTESRPSPLCQKGHSAGLGYGQ